MTQTTAERVAALLGDDGMRFETEDGREFAELEEVTPMTNLTDAGRRLRRSRIREEEERTMTIIPSRVTGGANTSPFYPACCPEEEERTMTIIPSRGADLRLLPAGWTVYDYETGHVGSGISRAVCRQFTAPVADMSPIFASVDIVQTGGRYAMAATIVCGEHSLHAYGLHICMEILHAALSGDTGILQDLCSADAASNLPEYRAFYA